MEEKKIWDMIFSGDEELYDLGISILLSGDNALVMISLTKSIAVKAMRFQIAARLRDIEKQLQNGKDKETIAIR